MDNLPVELIEKVLEECTSIDGCVELATDGISYVQMVPTIHPTAHIAEKKLNDVLWRRLQVTNVCKRWHLIGLRYLYVHLRVVVSGHNMSSSLKRINLTALRYTRRLTVVSRIVKPLPPTAQIITQINLLSSHMHRLSIVSAPAGIFSSYPPSVDVALCYAERHVRNLSVPVWDTLRVLFLDLSSMDLVGHHVDFQLNGLHSLHLVITEYDYMPSNAAHGDKGDTDQF
jgi:hypothetical protein